MQEQEIKIEKEHILERIKRIEFIKADEKELKTNYKFKNKEKPVSIYTGFLHTF